MKNFHDAGWKNSSYTSADVYILGFGCVLSQYPQFHVKDLEIYQVLPRPYLAFFGGGLGDNLIKKWVLDLVSQAEIFG